MTLEEFVNKILYVKFEAKGRTYAGIDCYGLPYLGYREVLGVELPGYVDDYIDAGDTKASRRAINDLIIQKKQNWDRVDKPQAMDVVVFRFSDTETHVGLMIDKNKFIHCEKKINTVVERLNSAKWEKRVEGVYRLKDKNVQ